MTPYVWRLCCLSLAVVFAVQFSAGLLMRCGVPRFVRYAERVEPSKAATLMLWLRWVPGLLGMFAALCLCVPAYLQLEPEASDEAVGRACVWMAGSALLSYLLPLGRALWNVVRSEVRLRALVKNAEECAGLFVIRETTPAMALAGLFHSRVVVSREVVQLLPADQMEAAQRHERAHQEARDNWKRLVIEAAPLDFCGRELRAAWSRFAEWAADDKASAGDSARSVALASALVSVARLGSVCMPGAAMLVESDGRELRVRVERLLGERSGRVRSRIPLLGLACVAATLALVLVVVAQQPVCAEVVHGVMESLVD